MTEKKADQSLGVSSLTTDILEWATRSGLIRRTRNMNSCKQVPYREGFGKPAEAGFPKRRSVRPGDRGDNFGAGALDVFKRLGKTILVTSVQRNIFGGRLHGL